MIAIADLGDGRGVAVTQIQQNVDGKLVPITCTQRRRAALTSE